MKKVQMEEELARRYTARLCRNGIIEEGCAEIYEYGFELLISSVVSVLLTIAIGAILHAGWFAVGYLVGLIPVRIYAGGYHARTHIECNIVFELIFAGSLIISNFLQYRQYKFINYFHKSGIVISVHRTGDVMLHEIHRFIWRYRGCQK